LILLNDLKRHHEATAHLVRPAVTRVLDSGWYVLGTECSQFETEFAAYCGVSNCVSVANGTDAIELALRALGVGAGSSVATVANAGFYATAALNAIGARPVYLDVDDNHYLMSLHELEAVAVSTPLAAIIVTHLYGRLHDMDRIKAIAVRSNIPVLEDCAQSHGARRAGRIAGSFGDAAAFSFYPTKNLGAMGDGGAVTTDRPDVADRARKLRQYGWGSKYRVELLGGRNSRLDELQAAVLRAKLPMLDVWNARRRKIARTYSEQLKASRVRCPDPSGEDYVAHLYVVRSTERELIRSELQRAGIATEIHYPIPDPRQPCWKQEEIGNPLPITEKIAEELFSLPCYPELTDDEVHRIIEVLS
jgi:aminotransferase EvaB